jgi:adenosylhomocysteine nucleosidase
MRKTLLVLLLLVGGLRAENVDILLAAASDAELQPLINRLVNPHTESRAAWQFWLGTIDGKSVALTRTEGDPLNAVAATTLAIRRYAPKLIVTFGPARAHDPALHPGDVVVSRSFAAFDGMVSPPRKLGAGSAPLAWHRLPHPMMTAGEQETDQTSFPADPAAQNAAVKLTAPRGRVQMGVLGSANQVNREADRINLIRAQWNTSTEDGESAHIAGCALLFGVPVVGLRVVDGTQAEVAALVAQFLEASK